MNHSYFTFTIYYIESHYLNKKSCLNIIKKIATNIGTKEEYPLHTENGNEKTDKALSCVLVEFF